MIPEWDVLVEIYKLKLLMPEIKLEYVRGHQDKDQAYATLPLLAQLNVDAEDVADQYQQEYGVERKTAFLLPSTAIHLELPQGTLTGHHPAAMRLIVWRDPLKQYMSGKYAWATDTIDLIHWEAHEKALLKGKKRHTHHIKHVHDNLPTNSRIHREDPRRQACPTCRYVKEDRDHVLKCPDATRELKRQEMLRIISETCDAHRTCPQLKHLLLQSIKEWLAASLIPPYSPNPQDFPTRLAGLIEHQTLIGWRQMFNGRFSTRWAHLQEAYYRRLPKDQRTKAMTGDKWLSNIIGAIWQGWFLVWEQRNNDLHGSDEATKREAQRRVAERE